MWASTGGRTLFLVAYDVCDPQRLHRVRKFLTAFKVGGQKSVFECWLTPSELSEVKVGLDCLMEASEDRLQVLALDPRMRPSCFGKAKAFAQTFFSIV